MKNTIEKLIESNSLKLRCIEAISKLSCMGCGTILSESELIEQTCPMCNDTSFKWMCECCNGIFNEPSLGAEHPCRSVEIYKLTGKIGFEYSDAMGDLDGTSNSKNLESELKLHLKTVTGLLKQVKDLKVEKLIHEPSKSITSIETKPSPVSLITPSPKSHPISKITSRSTGTISDSVKLSIKKSDKSIFVPFLKLVTFLTMLILAIMLTWTFFQPV